MPIAVPGVLVRLARRLPVVVLGSKSSLLFIKRLSYMRDSFSHVFSLLPWLKSFVVLFSHVLRSVF